MIYAETLKSIIIAVNSDGMNSRIQKLRAVAVVAVVLYHANERVSPNGYLGVDVFFLISGYLVIPKMQSAVRTGNLRQFYRDRFYRLTPALIGMLLICLFLILIFAKWSGISDFVNQAIFSLLYVGNFSAVLISGDYFSPDGFAPLIHLWSLSVEVQMYLLLPLIMLINKKALYLSIAVTSFLIFVFSPLFSTDLNTWLFYMFFSRFWEFMLGGLLARLIKAGKIHAVIWRSSFYTLTLLLLVPLQINKVIYTIVIVMFTSLCLVSSSETSNQRNLWTLLGDRSYSIYLYHLPLMYIAKFTPVIYGTNREIYTVLSILISLVLAEISYRFIENNFRSTEHKNA